MTEQYDSGYKIKWPLPPGVTGSAVFAGGNAYQMSLWRDWGPRVGGLATGSDNSFALWVGMNPSGLEGDVDDLTIRKECEFTRILGYQYYLKVNVATYRPTDIWRLDCIQVLFSHMENEATIFSYARDAAVVVLATGQAPDVLVPHARNLFRKLKESGIKPKCLGVTKSGWPKHSSRLGYATPFEEYKL